MSTHLATPQTARVTPDRPAAPASGLARRLPVGAEIGPGGTHFRVWAPDATRVSVVAEDRAPRTTLTREPGSDYFSGLARDLGAGARYWIVLDDERRFPDPASRFQPEGPHGPSEVVDPAAFAWTDRAWQGPSEVPVVYELHVGAFTREGSWQAAARQLPALADLGVTIIELLPIADFSGRFGWGYDGIALFAPTRLYGRPDDLRAFVDRAHAEHLAVILDVVYNHLGPDSELKAFSPSYAAREPTEWGDGLNYDGPRSGPVREFVLANVRHWIDEYHLDGLRLDATQSIQDTSRPHIVTEIARTVRAAAGRRRTWVVGENEPQHASLVRDPADGGSGLDAVWNDDFHHSARVALIGHHDAYYSDYRGRPQEFISAAKRGFLYQGQWYAWQHQPRGTPTDGVRPDAFVAFIQNHDQVANSLDGRRIHEVTSPGRLRAMTALLLLGPWTPMLFQGQEFAASTPFLYFADHQAELGAAIRRGRREFLAQFPAMASAGVAARLADPAAPDTFSRCRLEFAERDTHVGALALHRSLLRLRRTDPAFHDRARFRVDGAVLGRDAFVLRFCAMAPTRDPDRDRLLVVNLGRAMRLRPLPEPLLSPWPRTRWRAVWSSDEPEYGGMGVGCRVFEARWPLAAECAIVLAPDGVP